MTNIDQMVVSTEELASKLRYEGVTSAFREFLRKQQIKHIPHRPGYYNMEVVRLRLLESEGIAPSPPAPTSLETSLVAMRRKRLGKA